MKLQPEDFERLASDPNVSGALIVRSENALSQVTDHFDQLLLVVTEQREPLNYIYHYIKDQQRIQERWIHKKGIESWILNGENRSIIHWILQGDIVLDKDDYVAALREKQIRFPEELKEKRQFKDISLFLRRFLQCKEYLRDGHYLDAHSSILKALVHWARISIIENGSHPEITVWNQVKQINPGIYKLYEELTQSNEPLDKRVELLTLACEFSVMSKMEDCCGVLFKVLASRSEPWSASELKEHAELMDMHVELTLVLKTLARKALIKEVAVPGKSPSYYELKYTIPSN